MGSGLTVGFGAELCDTSEIMEDPLVTCQKGIPGHQDGF